MEREKNLIWKTKMGKKDNGLWIDDQNLLLRDKRE